MVKCVLLTGANQLGLVRREERHRRLTPDRWCQRRVNATNVTFIDIFLNTSSVKVDSSDRFQMIRMGFLLLPFYFFKQYSSSNVSGVMATGVILPPNV